MRDLVDGYGRGGGAMARWVQEHVEHDAVNKTDIYGRRPLPYGNYSLGSATGQ